MMFGGQPERAWRDLLFFILDKRKSCSGRRIGAVAGPDAVL